MSPTMDLRFLRGSILGCDLKYKCRCDGIGRRDGLKIRWANTPCGFESHHRHHVGAKSALLRRLFMPVAKKTSSARSLAPPFQLRPAALGSQLVCCPAGHIPISAAPHESASGARGKVHNFAEGAPLYPEQFDYLTGGFPL